MKLVSFNVNGIRACIKKGFYDFFKEIDADIFSIQETKMQEGQEEIESSGYYQYWNSAIKKGYSGTLVFTKEKPISVSKEMSIEEGRVLTLEYENFYLVNVYSPNSKRELLRLSERISWEEDFRNYLINLDKIKPVIICGDMNVAHREIDLKNPKTNTRNAGFTIEEREEFSKLLDSGFIDTFRYLYPNKEHMYTWWSYMRKARENNAGWRIDYFLVSDRLKEKIEDSIIYSDVLGSDHCPIGLNLK